MPVRHRDRRDRALRVAGAAAAEDAAVTDALLVRRYIDNFFHTNFLASPCPF